MKEESLTNLLVSGLGFVPGNVQGMLDKAPGVLAAYMKMRNQLLAEGVLDRKTKLLMSLAVMVATGVREGIGNYVQQAREVGAGNEEIIEAAGVGICFSGGRGIDGLILLCSLL